VVFRETKLQGVFEIHLGPYNDERGFFARCWCQNEFASNGLNAKLVQCNLSVSSRKGTLRGMHYQVPPYAETKLVRCTRGRFTAPFLICGPNRRHSNNGSRGSSRPTSATWSACRKGATTAFLTQA
jgi:dTDP-4-dehydrorhamnose 3,5-epimerase